MDSISIHDTKRDPIAQTHQKTTTEGCRRLAESTTYYANAITSQTKKQQTLLSSGDRVYLYGDSTYTGKLIRSLERTSPLKWTVQLDRGGYEAVNIQHITVIESSQDRGLSESVGDRDEYQSSLEIPFSDTPKTLSKPRPVLKTEAKAPEKLEQKIRILENTIKQLEAENQLIDRRYRELERENEILKKDLDQAKQIIRRAKDASPVMRLSLKRVLRLAHHACMDVQRTVGGWILRMGDKARKFRRLADIWDLISVDEFILSEIFPPEKLIAVDLIQPPKPRKKPEPREKKTFPLMRPEDVIRNRSMSLVRSG